MNVYDSKKMLDVLAPLGYSETDIADKADIVILNTCHIREKATDKVFSDLGRLRATKDEKAKRGEKQILAVAGCVAQAEGEFIAERAPYVDMIFGPQTYHRLPEMVADAFDLYGQKRVINTDFEAHDKFDKLPEEQQKVGVSAFMSIQEGCDKFCAFCVVPYTRGAEYSRPLNAVLSEAEKLVAQGAKELVLLGQNVNAYHGEADNGPANMGDLLYILAKKHPNVRLRYTTSHPNDMHDRLFEAHRDLAEVMPMLHLPVQSGADAVLKAMNRKHTRDDFFKTIDRLREMRPDMAFGSDFIIGFPGETDQDFEDTLDMVRRVGFCVGYSFKYSARPGTPATALKGLLPEKVKDERLQIMQALLADEAKKYNTSFIGKTVPVLFTEKNESTGQITGRTPYNQAVHVAGQERIVGHTLGVQVSDAGISALTGNLVLKEAA